MANNGIHNVAVGDKYNRLTVDAHLYTDDHYRKYWQCSCACGTDDFVTHSGSLRSGNTKSCGCLAKECKSQRISLNHSEVTAIILGYMRHAKGRGYEWSLTREQVQGLIEQDCHYCGSPPSNIKTVKNTIEPLLYSGIDRMDNDVGYVDSNVVACCAICNRAKLDMPYSDYINWIERFK